MSNELTAHAKAPLMAGARPMAIVPNDMESAYRIAKAVCAAGMAPKGLDTADKALVAIMHGLEIGLTPMTALQSIAIVNGRPTLWGDKVIGLVRGSGLCEYVKETITGTGDARIATCEAKRRGEPPIVRTFSVADAKTAGLWGKSGPWMQYPDRMLQMRSRAFTLRDGFADVLGGLYIKEEMDDVPIVKDITPPIPIDPRKSFEVTKPVVSHIQPKQSTASAPSHDEDTGEIDVPDYAALAAGIIERMTLENRAELWDVEVSMLDWPNEIKRALEEAYDEAK
jgi:hypothetical protein